MRVPGDPQAFSTFEDVQGAVDGAAAMAGSIGHHLIWIEQVQLVKKHERD